MRVYTSYVQHMMYRPGLLILCVFALAAQEKKPEPPAAPPEVDAALRARIQQFYQAHVDGKYRLADQVVAEDSKDWFFAAAKPRYLGFEIIRINYSDEFKKAEAVVSCQADWYVRGTKMKVNLPSTSLWKVVDGQWFWYIVPVTEVKTPFGTMNYNGGAVKDGAPPAAVPGLPGDPQVLAQKILEQVQTDKQDLLLSSYEASSGEVKIFNKMQGPITLRAEIDGAFPGLTFKLDKTEVKAGDSATLQIRFKPKDRVAKPSLTARVYVEPTAQVLPVKLTFAIPPEIEKLIPKDARPKP